MGLLDSLKKQAEGLREEQKSQESQRIEAIRDVDVAMNVAFGYLHDLFKQLAVIKPAMPLAFGVPNLLELKGLKFEDCYIDRRSTKINDREAMARIPMLLKWEGDVPVVIERDMPQTIEKVQNELWRYNLKFEFNEVRNAERKLVKGVFKVEPRVVTDVEIVANHATGMIEIEARNLMRLGPDSFKVPAREMNERLLEELAKALLGEANELRRYR